MEWSGERADGEEGRHRPGIHIGDGGERERDRFYGAVLRSSRHHYPDEAARNTHQSLQVPHGFGERGVALHLGGILFHEVIEITLKYTVSCRTFL